MIMVTGIDKRVSNKDGNLYYQLYFNDGNKSLSTYTGPHYRNFKNWERVIRMFEEGQSVFVAELKIKKDRIVDADSKVVVL